MSLPGSTRQSIFRGKMDPRVKPAGDERWIGAPCANYARGWALS